MFARPTQATKQTIDLNVNEGSVEEVQQMNGYLGFTFNTKYRIRRNREPEEGQATPEGTLKYSRRNSSIVDPSNFKSIKMMKGDKEHLTLSKLIFGTACGVPVPTGDLEQYNALKYAILSGGVNHIDTGH